MGSCPPGAGRSLVYGLWSMEWLSDQVHGDVGIVSSSRRKGKQAVVNKKTKQSKGVTMSKRKKVGGVSVILFFLLKSWRGFLLMIERLCCMI